MAAIARLILILAFVLAFAVFVAARFVQRHAAPGIKAARVLSETLHRQTLEAWREETEAAKAHVARLTKRG
jgi:hypothetical protein